MKASNDSEHLEQVTFINWFRSEYPSTLIFAIPNGEYRAITTAVRLKAEGVTAGVTDLFIPSMKLFIEMKKVKGGTVSKAQKEIIAQLIADGYDVIIAKGYKDAINQLKLLTIKY